MTSSVVGNLLSLALLMVLAYRGFSVLLLAPLMALLAVLASPDVPLLASYTQVFIKSLGGLVAQFFPLFLLGAVFGKPMEDSGAARAVAMRIVDWRGSSRAVLAVVLACAVLTYGGVPLFDSSAGRSSRDVRSPPSESKSPMHPRWGADWAPRVALIAPFDDNQRHVLVPLHRRQMHRRQIRWPREHARTAGRPGDVPIVAGRTSLSPAITSTLLRKLQIAGP